MKMARTLALAVEAREPYAHGHSERVGLLATEIAIELSCPGKVIREVQIAARLYDIGKIVIPVAPYEYRELYVNNISGGVAKSSYRLADLSAQWRCCQPNGLQLGEPNLECTRAD